MHYIYCMAGDADPLTCTYSSLHPAQPWLPTHSATRPAIDQMSASPTVVSNRRVARPHLRGPICVSSQGGGDLICRPAPCAGWDLSSLIDKATNSIKSTPDPSSKWWSQSPGTMTALLQGAGRGGTGSVDSSAFAPLIIAGLDKNNDGKIETSELPRGAVAIAHHPRLGCAPPPPPARSLGCVTLHRPLFPRFLC